MKASGQALTKTCPVHILNNVRKQLSLPDGEDADTDRSMKGVSVFYRWTEKYSASRACTGFDGGLEVRVAIRGPFPRIKTELNINANDNLAYAA